MKCFVILIVLVFASKKEKVFESVAANLGKNIMENATENSILKIEEDVYAKKKNKSSTYIGLYFNETTRRWHVKRWSKNEQKCVLGGRYKNEETAVHASDTLARKLMANGEQGHNLNFPDDNTEVYPEEKDSEYIGVYYIEKNKQWSAKRWSKTNKKIINYGYHKTEKTAAHASDTLARKLMANGDQNLKMNFPDDHIEVYLDGTEVHKKTKYSNYFGVTYREKIDRWVAQRWSKKVHKLLTNGANHIDEETAARASDTLARKLVANGERGHNLNFPDDNTELYLEERTTFKSFQYIGVSYIEKRNRLFANDEQGHKPNFPEDHAELHQEKTNSSQYIGVSYIEKRNRWYAQRWSKIEKKGFNGGYYKDEKTAAHASDTLAGKLIANGEHHKLNFPEDTEVHPEKDQTNKRKRSFGYSLETNLEKSEEKEK